MVLWIRHVPGLRRQRWLETKPSPRRRHCALGCGRSRERRRFRVLAYTTDLSTSSEASSLMKRRQNWRRRRAPRQRLRSARGKRLLHFVRLKTRQLRLPPRQAERLKPFPWKRPRLGCARKLRQETPRTPAVLANVLSLWQRRRRQRWRSGATSASARLNCALPPTRPPRSPPMKLNKQKSPPRWLLLASPRLRNTTTGFKSGSVSSRMLRAPTQVHDTVLNFAACVNS